MDKNKKIVFDDYHIHTNITDGAVTAEKIIEEAKKLKIKTIVFTEHISLNPTYDWFKFREEIENLKIKVIKILVGIETKVLDPNGKLNVNKDILESADVVLGSVHGIGNVEWLLNSECDIIAHPQINSENFEKFIKCNKILELNPQHPLEHEIIGKLVTISKNKFSFGSNTHKLEDLEDGQKYFSKINQEFKIEKMLVKL